MFTALFFTSCSKNILAGINSEIDKGHLIDAPLNFNLMSVTPKVSSASIQFPAVLNATSYTAQYRIVGAPNWSVGASAASSPVTVISLANGQNYDFRIIANNISGTSESDILQAMPNSLPLPFLITSIVADDTKLFVSWPSTTGPGPIAYTIRYGTSPGSITNVATTAATSPFTITGLTNGILYYVSVSAVNYVGEQLASNILSGIPSAFPLPPTNLILAGSAGTSCILNWTASMGIPPITYTLYESLSPVVASTGGSSVPSCSMIFGTSCVVVKTAGSSNNFAVRANNGAGSSTFTTDVQCNPVANSFNLTSAVATSFSTATVNYPAVAGATQYTTRYATTAGTALSGTIACNNIAGTTCNVTGLLQGTLYYFITTANSSSSYVNATSELSVITPTPPSLPLAFTSAGSVGTSCLFNWVASSGTPVISYTVKRSTVSGQSDLTGTVVPACNAISGTTNCIDNTLVAGTTYYYSIRSTNGGGSSAATSEISCTGIDNPFSITSVTQGNNKLNVTWPSITGATSYIVKYGFSSGSYSITSSSNAVSPYTINGLANGIPYYVMVTAVNSSSTQNAAAEGSGIPFNSPPDAINITPTAFNEDNSSLIVLSYTDDENNLASSCAVSALTNITLVTPCSCTSGICSVVIAGATNYSGAGAKFNYTLTDIGGVSNSALATLTINPVNDAPTLSNISTQTTLEDISLPVNFNLNDIDSVMTCTAVNLSATSSNTSLLSNSNILFTGTIPNCIMTLIPTADQNGSTTITLTTNDNGSPNLQDTKTYTFNVTAVNDSPAVLAITAQSTNEDTATPGIPFTISDVDSVLDCTTSISKTSSNTTFVPTANIVTTGTAPNCFVTVTPALNQNGGPVLISLNVTDGISTTVRSFNLTIDPVNDAPTVSVIATQTVNEDTANGPLAFAINDVDSTLICATSVSKVSSNTLLVPTANILILGTAPNCTVTVTPAANQNGGPVIITLNVTDGVSTTPTNFNLNITSVLDITSVSLPADAVYIQGQNLDFNVNFEGNVNVTGTPQLLLTVGSVPRTANYVSGSGTATLLFRYTPSNISSIDDYDSNGIVFSSLSVFLNSGTIKDSVSTINATLTFVPGPMTGILVDARSYTYSISLSANPVNENVGSVTATVALNQPSLQTLTFPLTISGTATLGSDYTTTLGSSIIISAGSTTAAGTLSIIDDAIMENTESITLNINKPSVLTMFQGGVSAVTLSINTNDTVNYPIAAGQTAFSTCVINQLNKLFCTGANSSGLLGLGDLNFRTTFTAVDAGTDYLNLSQGSAGNNVYHMCAITTGNVLKCWGNNANGQLGDGTATSRSSPTVITGGPYAAVSTGYHSTCAITTTGVLKCWGYNGYGQIGNGGTSNSSSPVTVDSGTNYSKISKGLYHTCGITTAGILKCWGYNGFGNLGNNTTTNSSSPTVIDSGTNYSQLSGSMSNTSCAITAAGVLKCWGQGTSGQLGNGAASNSLLPVIINAGTAYSKIAAGNLTTCGITTAGILKCWGGDRLYNIGLSASSNNTSPVTIHSTESFTDVILNDSRMCALTNTTPGILKCSGQRQLGQMGDNAISQLHSFTDVANLDNFVSLSLNGIYATIGLQSDGSLWSWGFSRGALDYFGDGSNQDVASSPIQVSVGSTFTKISKGSRHACAIRSDQKLYCWGINASFSLGDGTSTNRLLPVAIDAATNYIDVSVGNRFGCGITSTNVLKCWGDNSNGSLGDGTTTNRNAPIVINLGVSYKYLAQSSNYTMCAITTADQLRCWGYNIYGQVGVGGTTTTLSPTVVDSGVSYASVTASINHTCGITIGTNLLKCWGYNGTLALGDGTSTDRQLPTVFDSGTNYTKVGLSGLNFTCGITTTGALKCSGSRSAGSAASSQDGFGQNSNPILVDSGVTYTNLFSGYNSICGRTNLGTTKCVGEGIYGVFTGLSSLPMTTGLQFGTGNAASTLTNIGALP